MPPALSIIGGLLNGTGGALPSTCTRSATRAAPSTTRTRAPTRLTGVICPKKPERNECCRFIGLLLCSREDNHLQSCACVAGHAATEPYSSRLGCAIGILTDL